MKYGFMLIATLVVNVVDIAVISPAYAQTEKQAARAQEQARRLRAKVQELEQAQQGLQESQRKAEQEKAAIADSMKKRSGELATVRRKLEEEAKRATEQEAAASSLRQERDAQAARISELEQKLNAALTQQRETEIRALAGDDRIKALSSGLETEEMERKRCETNNLALYQYGRELMSLYQGKGIWSSLKQGEPLTRLGGVRIENLLEEYRDKLDKQKLQGLAKPATTSSPRL